LENFDSIKEKVRQSVSLVDVVADHVALRPSGRSFKGRCPFHSEKTPSFHVSPERGIFKCFGCGVGGDVFKFVQLVERVEFMDALRLLAERAGVSLPQRSELRRDDTEAQGPSKQELARVNAWATEVFRRRLEQAGSGNPAGQFLNEKGLSRETAKTFDLGLAPSDGQDLLNAAARSSVAPTLLQAAGLVAVGEQGDRYGVFRHRLMFPIRDSMNRVIGFGGRTLGDAPAKYVNTAQNALFDKGTNLYGLDRARKHIVEAGQAIVVEGYTDCLAAHQHGFQNTVATLGTALTAAHANLLRRYCDEVVLMFDSDAAGEAAADRALGVALEYGLRVTLARVPAGKDPCEFLQLSGAEGFRDVLKSRCEALGFKWEQTLARFQSPQGGQDRRLAMVEFAQFIAGLSRLGVLDPIQRGLIINDIARTVSVPAEEIQRLLARSGQRRPASATAGGPGFGRERSRPVAGDAEQAALTTILENLLIEPGLWSEACTVFEPQRFADERLRLLGERVRDHASRPDGLNVGTLVSSIESTEEASLLTDLMFRGERRAGHAESLRGAVSRLEQVAAARRARSLARDLRPTEPTGSDAEDDALRELGETHAHLAGGGQFLSRRVADDIRRERENGSNDAGLGG
jgi:DNA primase